MDFSIYAVAGMLTSGLSVVINAMRLRDKEGGAQQDAVRDSGPLGGAVIRRQ
jgi:hypothetical protein